MPIEPNSASLEHTCLLGRAASALLVIAIAGLGGQKNSNARPSYPADHDQYPDIQQASFVKSCVTSALARSYQSIKVLVSMSPSMKWCDVVFKASSRLQVDEELFEAVQVAE